MRYLTGPVEDTMGVERKMAFIAGPRQVGKTTMARALLKDPDQGYFNWDAESHRREILRSPESFWSERFAQSAAKRPRIVLDEIHKYPRWKRFVKGLYDLNRDKVEIAVTGSGRLDVFQKGGDSLLGRYNLHRLHPFTVGEFCSNGSQAVPSPQALDQALAALDPVKGAKEALELIERFTGFPEPLFASKENKLRTWRRQRRQLVLREDLRDLSRVRELGQIDQLVALLPERIGSLLSINALRQDLDAAFTTVQAWIATLERLYFLFELRPYASRLARTLRREGKVYLFDPSEIEEPGARFENTVALHLLKLVDVWNDVGYGDFSLHYVRDKEKREVDFLIVNRQKPYLLVESKLADTTPSPALRYFAERLKPKHALQLVRKGAVRVSGNLKVVPAERLLAHV